MTPAATDEINEIIKLHILVLIAVVAEFGYPLINSV